MTVVMAMLVVIAHHATVIVVMQRMVDVSEVVASHRTLFVYPNFTPKLTITALLSDAVNIIDDFPISHDSFYHGCGLWSAPSASDSATHCCLQKEKAGGGSRLGARLLVGEFPKDFMNPYRGIKIV